VVVERGVNKERRKRREQRKRKSEVDDLVLVRCTFYKNIKTLVVNLKKK